MKCKHVIGPSLIEKIVFGFCPKAGEYRCSKAPVTDDITGEHSHKFCVFVRGSGAECNDGNWFEPK